MTTTRRLAAILAADVAGYSRLMGADEVGTLEALKAHRREVVDPAIAANHGRIVKTTGDGLLAEFASAVDAVTCAMNIQQQMAARAGDIRFRIGINIGDIIIDGDDIFGDGVNVAARVENECEPGGVCLSDDAHRQIVGKTKFAFDDLGERTLKNIARPVRLFASRAGLSVPSPTQVGLARLAHQSAHPGQAPDAMGEGQGGGLRGHASTSPQTATPIPNPSPQGGGELPLPLPDKPSIAVLPFQNMSGDPEQDYFADGVVEDIITILSRFKSLFVIARNSSFTYKGKAVDVKQVGLELGVRYVLEGSVRRAGGRVRITGQLIDATSNAHLWADRFEGALEDIFDLQDRVTAMVVGAITPKLQQAEIERSAMKRPDSLTAYDLYLRALSRLNLTVAGIRSALPLAYQAIEAEPTYAAPYGLVAYCYASLNNLAAMTDRDKEVAEGLRCANEALARGKDDPEMLARAAMAISNLGGDRERGLALTRRALELNPNLAGAWGLSAMLHINTGSAQVGLEHCQTALRLSPADPRRSVTMQVTAIAYLMLGDYASALQWTKKFAGEGLTITSYSSRVLAVCAAHAGDWASARSAVAWLLENDKTASVAKFANHYEKELRWPRKNVDVMIEGLRRAGLPE